MMGDARSSAEDAAVAATQARRRRPRRRAMTAAPPPPRARRVTRGRHAPPLHAEPHPHGDAPDRLFRLARAGAQPGAPPREIASRRPSRDPGRAFPYRLAGVAGAPVRRDRNADAPVGRFAVRRSGRRLSPVPDAIHAALAAGGSRTPGAPDPCGRRDPRPRRGPA